jgi:hypothetical protein
LNFLGLLFYYKGLIQEAMPLLLEALPVMKAQLEPSHPELVDLHYNLACLFALQDDRERALSHLGQAVEGGFANPYITRTEILRSCTGIPNTSVSSRMWKNGQDSDGHPGCGQG